MKYFAKIYYYVFISLLILFGVISFFVLDRTLQNTLKQEKETAISKEQIVYLLIHSKLPDIKEESNLHQLGEFVSQTSQEQFMIFSKSGENLYTSNTALKNWKFEKEFPTKEGKLLISDIHGEPKNRYLILTEKIPNSPYYLAYIDPLKDYNRTNQELKMMYFMLLIAITFLSALIALLLANMLVRPIKQLIRVTTDITKGEIKRRAPEYTTDELGELGQSLNQMTDKLNADIDQITKLKTEQDLFLANLSHEIRTPLTSIIGYSQILQWSPLPQDDLESIQFIHSESQRLANLSNDLIKLSQLATYPIELQEISTEAIKADLHSFILATLKKTQIIILLKADTLSLDKNLFKLLAYNILSNSLRVLPDDGQITITGEPTSKTEYTLTFCDNGPGIPEHILEHVTEAFVTTNEARDDHHLGLGLSIVKKVVTLHHSTLQIMSSQSEGTKITVTLKRGKSL
ncbi:HAMP domain-containing sensor histidine kinase [Vagococcus silagei]|uniref:histidine kinase n=1 Tax=Vagococcus silagei TaxID=2508885 RepID=A0A4S3B7T0_9ENTE|nr:HAMP domain-containing sensor histidine kinase [Vagococcus silagei]THB62013.1 HAMP domain-containing histidine kinase [Vagococcus silagei]